MEQLDEFDRYMAHLCAGLGHSDRHAGLRGYCMGLMAPLKRKSVEPMAAHLAPTTTRSRHQSLHQFVADAAWSDEQMLLRVAQWVVPAMDFSDAATTEATLAALDPASYLATAAALAHSNYGLHRTRNSQRRSSF